MQHRADGPPVARPARPVSLLAILGLYGVGVGLLVASVAAGVVAAVVAAVGLAAR